MKARDLIAENESAIVIFTDGRNFHIERDGSGSTGNWKLDPSREYDTVIIYERDWDGESNQLYLAVPIDVLESSHEGRYVIQLKNIRSVGTTETNWLEFAEGGQNPIRYMT